ncbi:protein-lysine N-methyltransferase CG9154 [Phlebotomus argentipes]|uniref:protein-lysine N-methyltransferase CG9154 n=1 Tax=Phlebotomus argentipes TaxID=94469 RepID=UPI002893743C|nr:protein-lysine N-methyltransferase CG9154 [Phlebotomus argentipes]
MTQTPSDDEEICLPSDTLQILQEFLAEKAAAEEDLEENWQLSQFWYDEETISILTGACREISPGENFKIGLFSCPSLYKSVSSALPNVHLFEYDERFLRQDQNCVFYDYTKGRNNKTLEEFHHYFDLVLADPPFLSEECISKTAEVLHSVLKPDGKIILCSGVVVTPWAEKYLHLRPCNFQPRHKRNLGNEFASFANFNLDHFIQRK